MPRPCTICKHPDRTLIEDALLNGVPYRSITEHFGVSAGAIARHKADHHPAHLSQDTARDTIPRLPQQLENLVRVAANSRWELPMSGGGRLDAYVTSWAACYLTGDREEALKHLWDAHGLLGRYR